MNFEPFDTGLVIERLKALVPDLRKVGGAADYAAVQELRGFATPSAFVIFAGESGGTTGPRGARVQPAVTRFGLVLAVRNYRPGAGDHPADQSLHARLLGEYLGADRHGPGLRIVRCYRHG